MSDTPRFDLTKVAIAALEALEIWYDSTKAEADHYHSAMTGYNPYRHAQMDAGVQKIAKAITALRAAIAEPDADYERGFVDGMSHQAKSSVDRAVNAMIRKPLTDEPEVFNTLASLRNKKTVGPIESAMTGRPQPAAQWQGLPDMLVYDLADTYLYGGENYGILSFYKAMEAKLKEKNT